MRAAENAGFTLATFDDSILPPAADRAGRIDAVNRAAFVAAAHCSGAGISAVARALIAAAGGQQVPVSDRVEALSIWGDSLIDRPVRLLPSARSA